MATIKIDGREIPFEPGDTVIKAAHRSGIDIPHYCWHPGLSVAANCRMCLVEVPPPPGRPAMQLDILRWDAEKQDYVPARKPKLLPACQTTCAPGMEVLSESSDHVAEARSAVQELQRCLHDLGAPVQPEQLGVRRSRAAMSGLIRACHVSDAPVVVVIRVRPAVEGALSTPLRSATGVRTGERRCAAPAGEFLGSTGVPAGEPTPWPTRGDT